MNAGNANVGLSLDVRRKGEDVYDPRRVQTQVRDAVYQFGGTSLGELLPARSHVLIKPNWVTHRNAGGHGTTCLTTQESVIAACLQEVLESRPTKITIGDAPIQGCAFDRVISASFVEQVRHLASRHNVPIEIVDFRRTITRADDLSKGVLTEQRDRSRYVEFDLGSDSLLEPISQPGCFRVTSYDPDKLARVHAPGVHRYLLCKEAFEADVVLSLPKLKLHKKAGITGAIKNLVGLNGEKDFLPHHRVGGALDGGDCYPGSSTLRALAERSLDQANRHIGHRRYGAWTMLTRLLWLATPNRDDGAALDASWAGNDTCWRMCLDLVRIALHGRADGTMADGCQRRLYTLTDAIVCGEGDGPLAPSPLYVGALTFSDSVSAADVVHAALLRLDLQMLPLVRESFGAFRWPIATTTPIFAVRGGRQLQPAEVASTAGVNSQPPRGWQSLAAARSRAA